MTDSVFVGFYWCSEQLWTPRVRSFPKSLFAIFFFKTKSGPYLNEWGERHNYTFTGLDIKVKSDKTAEKVWWLCPKIRLKKDSPPARLYFYSLNTHQMQTLQVALIWLIPRGHNHAMIMDNLSFDKSVKITLLSSCQLTFYCQCARNQKQKESDPQNKLHFDCSFQRFLKARPT